VRHPEPSPICVSGMLWSGNQASCREPNPLNGPTGADCKGKWFGDALSRVDDTCETLATALSTIWKDWSRVRVANLIRKCAKDAEAPARSLAKMPSGVVALLTRVSVGKMFGGREKAREGS
jgi:hypothetical protein